MTPLMTTSAQSTPTLARLRDNLFELRLAMDDLAGTVDLQDPRACHTFEVLAAQYEQIRAALAQRELREVGR